MKPVRVASLLLAVFACAPLPMQAQLTRAGEESSSSESKARDVAFRPTTPADAPSALAATAPVIFGSIATAAAGATPLQVFTARTAVFLTAGPTATPCFFSAYLPDGSTTSR